MNDRIDSIKRDIMSFCRCCRKRHNITQKRLSEITGVNDSVFSIFENGRFSFENAQHYYKNVMDKEERARFISMLNNMRAIYLEVQNGR